MKTKPVLPAYVIINKRKLCFTDRVLLWLFKLATSLDKLGEAILEERFQRAVRKIEHERKT